MGAHLSQNEGTQSSNPTGTTQVKQQNNKQDEEKQSAPSQSSKATATARESKPPYNHEEHPKKTNVSMSSEINSQANGTKTEVKLPHNYETIIQHSDSPIDGSSVEKIYEQLQAGVFLDQKRKKYWVEKRSNNNCFMIYAKDLLITWAEDARYWRWIDLKETSDEVITVAELQNVCWLEVHGTFGVEKLSPGVLYEVVFLVMMKDLAYGWEAPVKLRLILPDGNSQEHEENLKEKPKGKWMEISVGELRTSTENSGNIQFFLDEYNCGLWKRGLVIKGIIIRPKV